jgi:ParB-like chromosome segregation protein Spo0J
MKITKMKLSDLRAPDKNIRIHTEKQLKEFERSIKMFGQIRPIVVDENNTILAGNGLTAALTNLGYDKVDVYKINDLTENQKKKLMIADNKIYALGIENLSTLNEFLEELGTDMDIPGFDEEILRAMVAEAEEVTAKISEYGALNAEEIEKIRSTPTDDEDDPPGTSSAPNEQPAAGNTYTETRRSVVCPDCGKEIWL